MMTEDVGIQCASSSLIDKPVVYIQPGTPSKDNQDEYEDDFTSDSSESDDSSNADSDDNIPIISYEPDQEVIPTISYLSVPQITRDSN